MVHQWQDETGRPIDHGRAFRAKAREVGIAAGRAPRAGRRDPPLDCAPFKLFRRG